jgi:hypothetical protein
MQGLTSRDPYQPPPFPVVGAKKGEREDTWGHGWINHDGNGGAFPAASAEQAFGQNVNLNVSSDLGALSPRRGEFRRGFPDFPAAAAPNAQQCTLPRAL